LAGGDLEDSDEEEAPRRSYFIPCVPHVKVDDQRIHETVLYRGREETTITAVETSVHWVELVTGKGS
jgi:hypothetical protein